MMAVSRGIIVLHNSCVIVTWGQSSQVAINCENLAVLAQDCGNIEKAAISSSCRRTFGWHGYDPVRSRLPLLVPFSKPSIPGARACRIATSDDCLAPATPSPTSAPVRRPAPVGVALPSAAAGPRNLGTRRPCNFGARNCSISPITGRNGSIPGSIPRAVAFWRALSEGIRRPPAHHP